MIHDLLSLEAYFAQFVGQFGIAHYIFGGLDEIVMRESKGIRYPSFCCELFEERLDDEGKSVFSLRLSVEKKAGKQPRSEDRKTVNDLRHILRQVLEKMYGDSPNTLVFYRRSAKFYYKEHRTGDDNLMALVEIDITGVTPCED